MEAMDYVELSKVARQWSPSAYAWECLRCPLKVRVLDGHIDPKKGTALTDRYREKNRLDLFRAIGIIGFGLKPPVKVDEEVRPKNDVQNGPDLGVNFDPEEGPGLALNFGSKNDYDLGVEVSQQKESQEEADAAATPWLS